MRQNFFLELTFLLFQYLLSYHSSGPIQRLHALLYMVWVCARDRDTMNRAVCKERFYTGGVFSVFSNLWNHEWDIVIISVKSIIMRHAFFFFYI